MTYSTVSPPGSFTFLGLPVFGFVGVLDCWLLMKCENISVCLSKKSKRLLLSVSSFVSKSSPLPLDDNVSEDEAFCNHENETALLITVISSKGWVDLLLPNFRLCRLRPQLPPALT